MVDKILEILPSFVKFYEFLSKKIKNRTRQADKNEREYKFISSYKNITIFRNNHGIIQISPKLKVEKDTFDTISHFFNLNDCGRKDITLDSFAVLMGRIEKDPMYRFGEQTFCCKVISINNEVIEHGDRWPQIDPDPDKESPIQKAFFIKFKDRNFKKGDEIVYLYGYSCPQLYPVQKTELSNFNPGNLDFCKSTLKLLNDIDDLRFIISFEEGIKLAKLPELWRRDQRSNKEKLIGKLKREEDLYYTRYSINIKNGKHGYDYTIKWWYLD